MKSIKLVFDEKLARKVFGKSIDLIDDENEKQQAISELDEFIKFNEDKVVSYFYDDEKFIYYEEEQEMDSFLWRTLNTIFEDEDFFTFCFNKNIQPSFEIFSNELEQTESITIPYKMIVEGNGENLRDFALKKINFSDGYLYE